MPANPAIVCAADCATENLPVVAFEDCAPKILGSEFQRLYVGRKDAAAFSDITSAVGWTDRISETNTPPGSSTVTAPNLLRQLTIIGDMPAPSPTTRAISGGRTIRTKNTYTLNFEMDDVSDENYAFAQKIQCGKGAYPVKVWPVTKSGKVLGGNAGIVGKMSIDHIFDRGDDGIIRLVGTVTFDADIAPNMDTFPLTLD
jgi:hypothetical protein